MAWKKLKYFFFSNFGSHLNCEEMSECVLKLLLLLFSARLGLLLIQEIKNLSVLIVGQCLAPNV